MKELIRLKVVKRILMEELAKYLENDDLEELYNILLMLELNITRNYFK